MKKLVAAVVVVLGLFGLAMPSGAITYGELDDGEHPYVGFMIFFVPSEPGWFSCSGTLLDADTFLTAAHCTFDIGIDGLDAGPSGGTDVWVTVAPADVLAGWPARADYPTEEALYAARSAWLDANSSYTTGTAYPHPLYDDFADFPVNHDVGVVELDEQIVMSTYGELAPLDAVATLAGDSGHGRNDALVETVGYGIQSVQPKPADVETRYKSTSRIVEVNGNQAQGGNLHTLNNPSAIGGRGGSCFGDSGGPVFINNTNQILGVVSYGPSATCHGADYAWRVDTQAAADFVQTYLSQ
jgi:Trypsin